MYATIRRYEGVDRERTAELTCKVGESLLPRLRNLQGFKGYSLIEAGNGVISSLGLVETSEQGDESTRVSASWSRDETRETAFPNSPKITSDGVLTHKNGTVS